MRRFLCWAGGVGWRKRGLFCRPLPSCLFLLRVCLVGDRDTLGVAGLASAVVICQELVFLSPSKVFCVL